MNRTSMLRGFAASRTYICPSCLHTLSRPPLLSKAKYSSVASSEDAELFEGKPPTLPQSWTHDAEGVDLKTALTDQKLTSRKNGSDVVRSVLSRSGGIVRRAKPGAKVRKTTPSKLEESSEEPNPDPETSLRELHPSRDSGISAQLQPSSLQQGNGRDVSDSKRSAKETKSKPSGSKQRDKVLKEGPRFTRGEIKPQDISIEPLESDLSAVPKLSHGLERVLFNPGFFFLQDPRSRVYNFDPYLEMIMPVSDFDFGALKRFTPSSRDDTLAELTRSHGLRYSGSTSSMTAILSHFHYLLSAWRPINTDMLSAKFPVASKQFTQLQRGPAASLLRWNAEKEIYAIDADKTFSSSNVLSMLGLSMEKLLTLETSDYERYRLSNNEPVPEDQRERSETYHFSTAGDFLFRSQLDARDARLPGTGVFDLKTRAVIPVRMNVKDYQAMRGYEITNTSGEYESFEREYHDMIRATFLKYSMQVRMGRMDGIFVAYHNTERIFGFQYIPLSEMDLAVHGQSDTSLGDQEFKFSLKLLNRLLDIATERYPKTSLRLHCEMRQQSLYFFAEPVSQPEIDALEAQKLEEEKKFEDSLLVDETSSSANDHMAEDQSNETAGLDADAGLPESVLDKALEAEDRSDMAAESADSEELLEEVIKLNDTNEPTTISLEDGELEHDKIHENGGTAVAEDVTMNEEGHPQEFKMVETEIAGDNETILPESTQTLSETELLEEEGDAISREEETSPEQPDVIDERSIRDANAADSAFLDRIAAKMTAEDRKDVLFLQVRIQNKVGDRPLARPSDRTSKSAAWSTEYNIEEGSDPDRNWSFYQACKRRRAMLLGIDQKRDSYHMSYIRRLRHLSQKGAAYRKRREQEDAGKEKITVESISK